MSHPDVHTLSGAYALDALSPEEAAEFRRHLEGCPACRDEVRELRSAAADLGASTASAPPPDLRRRVLAAADRTPQGPPAPASRAPAPASTPSAHGPLTARPRIPGRPRAWLAVAAAAVLVVAGAVVGVRELADRGGQQLASTAVAVFDAEDARTATVDTTNGGRLTVGVSRSLDEMAVDTRDLPALDEGHVYQIWAVHDGRTSSAAVLSDPGKGAAMGIPAPGTTVALTIEPAGGSDTPTTDPIAQVDPGAV